MYFSSLLTKPGWFFFSLQEKKNKGKDTGESLQYGENYENLVFLKRLLLGHPEAYNTLRENECFHRLFVGSSEHRPK